MNSTALFLFLAAGSVALFAFLSIVGRAAMLAGERKGRDRFALLKTLAEQPGENARAVLAMLREEDERKEDRRIQEERRGFLIGGLICLASGIGVMVMIHALETRPGTWTVGLIPLFVGMVLTPFGLLSKGRQGKT